MGELFGGENQWVEGGRKERVKGRVNVIKVLHAHV
jgi:hypothetical protein